MNEQVAATRAPQGAGQLAGLPVGSFRGGGMSVRSCNPTFRGAGRGAGSSGFFDLSRRCGSTNERDKKAMPIRSHSCHQRSAIRHSLFSPPSPLPSHCNGPSRFGKVACLPFSPRSARMPRSEERGGMAARSEAEAHSLLVYKSPAWKGGVLYSRVDYSVPSIYLSQGSVDRPFATLDTSTDGP